MKPAAARRGAFQFIFSEVWGSDEDTLASWLEGKYTKQQIRKWCTGENAPNASTLKYIMEISYVPEFRIVFEHEQLDRDKPRKWLGEKLGEYSESRGIYAFYGALGNCTYVGKANAGLLNEIYQTLRSSRRTVAIEFPTNRRRQNIRRKDLVTYVSAYHVPSIAALDYPKHIESLFLRIHRPPLNSQSGRLERVEHTETTGRD